MADDPFNRFDDVIEFRNSLNPESDRGCALMAASFLDSELDLLLRQCVVNNHHVIDDIFGQSRPISTFSSRIDLSYLLGLIDSDTHRDLHLIRKIRNDFGHVHTPLSFEERTIAARCRELKIHFRDPGTSSRKIFISCAVGVLAILHTGMHNRQRIEERKAPNIQAARATADRLTEAIKVALDDNILQSDDRT